MGKLNQQKDVFKFVKWEMCEESRRKIKKVGEKSYIFFWVNFPFAFAQFSKET